MKNADFKNLILAYFKLMNFKQSNYAKPYNSILQILQNHFKLSDSFFIDFKSMN